MSLAFPNAMSKPTTLFGVCCGNILKFRSHGALRFGFGQLVPERIMAAWRRDPISLDLAWTKNSTSGEVPNVPALPAWARLIASVNVKVPIDICLVRDISVPRVALARTDSILRFDLEATTPFSAADVFTGWYEIPGGTDTDKAEVRQIVVKRSTISPLLHELKRKNLPLRAISVVDSDGSELPVNLLDRVDRSRAWLVRATASGVKLSFALAFAAALVAATLTFVNLRHDIESATAVVAETSAELQAALKRVNDAETVATQIRQPRLQKAQIVPVVAVWEELTNVLPRSTWLNDIRIEDSAVQIDGQSANASELIEALARSRIFVNGAFASPVTRDAQRGFERFQIRVQTKRVQP